MSTEKSTQLDMESFSAALKSLYTIGNLQELVGGVQPSFELLEKKDKLRKANIFKHIKEKYINGK